jgi:hypothetical protein
MPKGARHIETGILRPGCWGYSLHMDGGGIWELDVTRSPRRLLGQRVTVEGTRAGFNLLNVTRIRPVVVMPPTNQSRCNWLSRLRVWL